LNTSLTSVPGIRVGHARSADGATGCTVVLGPFRGAVEIRGLATGTREMDALSPHHLVETVDAVLLTGGSAFGLAAADGVMSWLAERGRGFPTGVTPVPIVPAAVIFDLTPGGPRPDATMGSGACDDATDDPVREGRVGAGSGATVGKLAGPAGAAPGGVGSWAVSVGAHRVGALAVVNALGDVRDAEGRIIAGARDPAGEVVDSMTLLASGKPGPSGGGLPGVTPGTNTTLAVVATDAPVSRTDLGRVARMAANAMARRITPVHTPFDGDVVMALSTHTDTAAAADPAWLTALGAAAQEALEEAIVRAVTQGRS